MAYDVIVVGDYYLDLIFTGMPGMPPLGEEYHSQGFEMTPGGSYITAVAMQRLGVSVGWAADFGNDEFSRWVVERSAAEGLDGGLFVHHDRPLRRVTVSASFPEDRAFITYIDPDPPVPAALKALTTARAGVLYVGGLYTGGLFDAGLRLVRLKRMKLVMDGNTGTPIHLDDPGVRKSIRGVDAFLPNQREALWLTGADRLEDALRCLGELCPLVVVKAGEKGAYAIQGGEIVHAPALKITPVDTTGAGDCFSAGFVAAWLKRLPLIECLKWGNIAGGLSTLEHGGTGRVVRPEDIQAHLHLLA